MAAKIFRYLLDQENDSLSDLNDYLAEQESNVIKTTELLNDDWLIFIVYTAD